MLMVSFPYLKEMVFPGEIRPPVRRINIFETKTAPSKLLKERVKLRLLLQYVFISDAVWVFPPVLSSPSMICRGPMAFGAPTNIEGGLPKFPGVTA